MAVGNNISNIYRTTVGGRTYQIDPASQGGYMNAYAQYEQDRANQLNETRNQLDRTLAQNNATTNANYDNSARQAYVQYMQRQRALPSQLQALGVNGGATESGLLNLYNNYGSSHAANEQQRNADLTTNQQNRDDAYNNAYQAYLSDLNEQKQQAISNQINEYNNEITRFSSSVAQYPTTAGGYQKYEEWIKNMAASSDPLKDIKVALIRQQMATQFPDGNPAGSGSGSGGGGGGGRRYGGRRYGSGGGGGGGSSQPSAVTQATSGLRAYDAVQRTVRAARGLTKSNTVRKKGDTYSRRSNGTLRRR
jgi:hypothetical protein